MYGWIWRHLPGPTGARVALAALLLAVVLAVLFAVVFPAVEALLPFDDSAVGWADPSGCPGSAHTPCSGASAGFE
jgi:hypothetical protein